MTNEELAEMYKLVEKAKLMEKVGNEDKALELYLEIHQDHHPNTSFLFDRPISLLEKKRKYREAIMLCDKALELISKNQMTGTADNFHNKKERLISKMNQNHISGEPEKQKMNLEFSFTPIKALAVVAISIAIIIGAIQFLPKESPYEDLYIDMTKFETKSDLQGSIFDNKSDPNLPPITQTMVENAIGSSKLNDNVIDARVVVSGDLIGIAIRVSPSTSVAESKKIGFAFIKSLAGMAASESPIVFGAASKSSYGKLYDYYAAFVAIGADKNDIKAKGVIDKKAQKTKWLDK